ELGLHLFDRAGTASDALVAPMQLDAPSLQAQARAGTLPPLLSGLVRAPARRDRGRGSLADQLADVPEAEWGAAVLELVRNEVSGVLGHSSAAAIDTERAFKELGFDSL